MYATQNNRDLGILSNATHVYKEGEPTATLSIRSKSLKSSLTSKSSKKSFMSSRSPLSIKLEGSKLKQPSKNSRYSKSGGKGSKGGTNTYVK